MTELSLLVELFIFILRYYTLTHKISLFQRSYKADVHLFKSAQVEVNVISSHLSHFSSDFSTLVYSIKSRLLDLIGRDVFSTEPFSMVRLDSLTSSSPSS